MPGPRYVKDFEFPSSFGFSGSATDRTTVPVRGYERNRPRRRFQQGGRVESEEDRRARLARERLEAIQKAKREGTLGSSKKAPPKPESKSSGTIRADNTDVISAVSGRTRREQEEKLGLAKGGRVKLTPQRVIKSLSESQRKNLRKYHESDFRGALSDELSGTRDLADQWDSVDDKLAERVRQRLLKPSKPTKKAMGGPVKAAKGCGPEVRKAMKKHLAAAPPRGHGVK